MHSQNPIEAERFERLMNQHRSMKAEERHRIVLWLVSAALAILSFVELLQLLTRKKHS